MIEISTTGFVRSALLLVLLLGGVAVQPALADGKTQKPRVQVISGGSASQAFRPAGRLRARPAARVTVHASTPKLRGGPSQARAEAQCLCNQGDSQQKASAPQIINIERQNGVLVVNQTRHRRTN